MDEYGINPVRTKRAWKNKVREAEFQMAIIVGLRKLKHT